MDLCPCRTHSETLYARNLDCTCQTVGIGSVKRRLHPYAAFVSSHAGQAVLQYDEGILTLEVSGGHSPVRSSPMHISTFIDII